jgi:hypothetical protein
LVKTTKNIRIFALVLLTSAILLMAINPNLPSVKAQTQATVVVFSAVGGITTPTGTTTYAAGTTVTLTATAGDGFYFQNWVIVTTAGGYNDFNNPTSLIVNASATYAVQAVFQPIQPAPPVGAVQTPETPPTLFPDLTHSPDLANDAIVVVLAGVGGTTTPAPGTYAMANAVSLNLTAIPNTGFTFSHWVIGGSPLSHGAYSFTDTPTDNPYNVNHGYGNTYSYQPVFNAISPSTSPTPKVDEFSSVAAIILAMVLVIVAFGAYTFTKKAKK